MANCIQCGRKMPGLGFGKKICPWCVQHEAAQRGEDGDNAKQIVVPAPWVRRGESSITLTQVLLGANVAVFIAMVLASGAVADFPGRTLLAFGANVGPLTLSGQWWRLVTYIFLHGGLMHIAFNMWCLWDLGALCESLYGRWTFATIYVLTGVAGGVASVGWNPFVNSVGASGAIFGLAGALVASFYLGEFSLPKIAIQGTLRSLVFFIGFNVLFGSFFPGIDNACHAGGLVCGLMAGALIARVAPERDNPARRVGVLLFVLLIVGGAAFGVQRWRGSTTPYRAEIFAKRQAERMIDELEKKVQLRPQDAAARSSLAQAYFTNGQIAEGEGQLKRVLELQPQNTLALRDLGAAHLSQSQAKQAHAEFAAWLALEPNNAEAHVWLGMALAAEQDPAAAIEEYQTALRFDPKAEGVYYKIGISQAQLKKYDEAISSYLKERELTGDDLDLENALADAYQAKGMMQQGAAARSRAAQLKSAQHDDTDPPR